MCIWNNFISRLQNKNFENCVEQTKYKKTIIMVTHDMNIASRADIHIKMDAGQIVSVDGR